MKSIPLLLCLFVLVLTARPVISQEEDPWLWLEEVEGARALDWVKAQNAATVAELEKHPEYAKLHTRILGVLNSKDRIAWPNLVGEYVYNFWQDEKNPRGLWRRTLIEEYLTANPEWETVLDLDLLSEQEKENWAFGGATFLHPGNDLCLIHLSRGGSDAEEIREFDPVQKKFIAGGFFLPQAKSGAAWLDRNTLLVATDFGAGTLTTSGYPRIVKIWHRGTPLAGARTLYEGSENDMGVWAGVENRAERQYVIVSRMKTFYTSERFILENDQLLKLDLPEDAQLHGFFKNQLLVELKTDWHVAGQVYAQGALVSIDYDKFLRGDHSFSVVFQPSETASLASVATTQNYLLLNKIDNVTSVLYQCYLRDGQWGGTQVPLPGIGTASIAATADLSDRYFFTFTNYLTPTTLYHVAGDGKKVGKIASLPDYFKTGKLTVEQLETVSRDGTRIPYFIVHPKTMKLDGSNPTLLYGYGGFEVSMQPGYSAINGLAWMESGGVYVVANIRGGGEFGPKWHQSALKENRQRAFDDFHAVAEDLIRRKITSPRHLGIEGGSNGGLLVGVAFTQRPELYNAVICSVPLLDMRRYNKLLAGASWMGEYGNPDLPEEWAWISKYSPYQNLQAGKKYPQVLFTTTTRDDRVHPGHARKMAAKMESQGHPFYYFENTEGGHGSGVTNEQRAKMVTLEYVYLLKMLK